MNGWPHLHPGHTEACVVTERTAPDGTVYARLDAAPDRTMIAASLLATAEQAALAHVSVVPPDGFGGSGSLSVHTPVLTVTYRLDRYCAGCDAWEASRA